MAPLRRSLSALLAGAVLAATPWTAVAAGDVSRTTTTTTTSVALPCTATSTSGAFYELQQGRIAVAEVEGARPRKGAVTEDYHARGWDYGSNFTLNLCAPLVRPVRDLVGLNELLWQNIDAYYESRGSRYSLG